jgi:hypothetical protein
MYKLYQFLTLTIRGVSLPTMYRNLLVMDDNREKKEGHIINAILPSFLYRRRLCPWWQLAVQIILTLAWGRTSGFYSTSTCTTVVLLLVLALYLYFTKYFVLRTGQQVHTGRSCTVGTVRVYWFSQVENCTNAWMGWRSNSRDLLQLE